VSCTSTNASTANGSQNTTVQLVTRDATSGIRCPASGTEWTNFLAYYGISTTVSSAWKCDEASGNAADCVGSLTLTASGTPTYQQTVSGWSRKGFGFTDAGAQKFVAASGTGPNPATTSVIWCFYITMPTSNPAATRTIMGASHTGTTQDMVQIVTTGKPRAVVFNVTTDGTVNVVNGGTMPMLLKYDRTNSAARLYNTNEKITATYNSGVLDGNKGVGPPIGTAATMNCVYGFMLQGANAELSDATVKTLLQSLGWTIPWS